jgi:bifunctional UDP-N-acetylglucosamine pyrophosphorylase/glucosamine-1-phosphate N-acetyltransferase
MREKSSKKLVKMNIHCVILAAGMGTRMKSSKSKVLHAISGKPMVEIVLDLARTISNKITVVASKENIHDISSLLQNNENAILQEERLGTAHAVLTAKNAIEKSNAEKILVLYADTPLVQIQTLEEISHQNNTVTFLGFQEHDTTNKYGRLITKGNSLLEIIEYKDANSSQKQITLCNSGVVCAEKSFLLEALQKLEPSKVTGEYYLTDIAHLANESKKTCGFILCEKSEVLGVNSRQDLTIVDAIMQERIKNHHMQNGVTFLLPHTTYIHLDVQIAQDVTIEPNCFIGTKVSIMDNVEIRAFSHLECCTVHSNVTVGPFARIRPNTELHSGSRIGNFVEVKNSIIGENSKVNHLAYIGDCNIEQNCNIGAGTIVCNYNGFKKFRSTIRKNSFIGSNSTIISPVEISDGTIVAAGSVIAKSTQANSLVITRATQTEIPNGGEKFRKKHGKQV